LLRAKNRILSGRAAQWNLRQARLAPPTPPLLSCQAVCPSASSDYAEDAEEANKNLKRSPIRSRVIYHRGPDPVYSPPLPCRAPVLPTRRALVVRLECIVRRERRIDRQMAPTRSNRIQEPGRIAIAGASSVARVNSPPPCATLLRLCGCRTRRRTGSRYRQICIARQMQTRALIRAGNRVAPISHTRSITERSRFYLLRRSASALNRDARTSASTSRDI